MVFRRIALLTGGSVSMKRIFDEVASKKEQARRTNAIYYRRFLDWVV